MENIIKLIQFYSLKRLKKIKKNLSSLTPGQIKLRQLFHKALKDNENIDLFTTFLEECQREGLTLFTLKKALFLDAENEIERLMFKVQEFVLSHIQNALQQYTSSAFVVDDLIEIALRLLPNSQKKLSQISKRCYVIADILELMGQANGKYGAAIVNLHAAIRRKRAEKRDKRPSSLTIEQINLYEQTVTHIRQGFETNEEALTEKENLFHKDKANEIVVKAENIYQESLKLQRRILLTQNYLQKIITSLTKDDKIFQQQIQKSLTSSVQEVPAAISHHQVYIKCMIVNHFKKILESEEGIFDKTQKAKSFLLENKQVFEIKEKKLSFPKFFSGENLDLAFLKSLDLSLYEEPKINLTINIIPALIK